MRSGLVQGMLLQHAACCWENPPSSSSFGCKPPAIRRASSPSCCSPFLRSAAAPSFLLVLSQHRQRPRRREDFNNHQSSRCTALSACIIVRRCYSFPWIASPSSPSSPFSTVSDFASASAYSSLRGLSFCEAEQFQRSLTLGCALLTDSRCRNKFSWRGIVWRCLGSSGQGQGARLGSQGRVELLSMADSTGVSDGYRPNVGLCLVNEKDEVFVASRLDIPDSWQMPQGGVDDGEEPRDAAIRELREETGVTTFQLIGEVPEWLTYDFPSDVKTKITRLWGKEWHGQAQKWFLFRFTGADTEINLAGDGSENPEFGDWKWLPAEEVLKMAVEFKRPVYAQAFKSLAGHIDSWSKL